MRITLGELGRRATGAIGTGGIAIGALALAGARNIPPAAGMTRQAVEVAGPAGAARGSRATTPAAPDAQASARALGLRSGPSVEPPTASDTAWVDSVLASLTLRERAGQMIMRWVPGVPPADTSRMGRAIREWIEVDRIGGIIISIGPPATLASHTARLQSRARVPLLVAADIEMGPGQRLLPGGTMFPPPMGVAATGDSMASCWHGRITAREARAVGIHWAFAPDVDVNLLPDNPIINIRSYGDRAEDVARHAAAFITCAQDAGMLTTAKHLAGLGAAGSDSHLVTSVIPFGRARLDSVEFAPFRAAQRAGVAAMMSGHIAIPAVAGDSIPLSLNPKLLRGIVRNEWNYDGLIVSDAMWMRGATRTAGYTAARGAVLAVLAGNDVILDPPNHRPMIDALVAAVEDGTISRARIDSSVRRILLAKARVGLAAQPTLARSVPLTALTSVPGVGGPEADSIAADVARRSIVLVRDSSDLLPIDFSRYKRILVISHLDEGRTPAPGLFPNRNFIAELRRLAAPHGATVDSASTTRASTAVQLAALSRQAGSADLVILAPFVRPLAERGSIAVPAAVRVMFSAVLAKRRPAIVVAFGDPYGPARLPGASTLLLAWAPWSSHAELAAARALAGAAPITGRLPVTLGPGAAAGGGLRRNAWPRPVARDTSAAVKARYEAALRAVLERGLADSAYPGAVAMVGSSRGVIAASGVGRQDWKPSRTVDEHTIWDLASLTKVVALTTAMMRLVDRGAVDLDAPVQRYLPEWTGRWKDRVTVRHLLTHSSGLPAWRPLYKEAAAPDSVRALVFSTPLDTLPGVRYRYSDVGAITAGMLVERVSGQTLDAFVAEHIFTPLGMTSTRYNPPLALRDRIPPTEFDPWRQRQVHGEVHDENAFSMGGVSAHAGLFSSAHDLARFAQMYLLGGTLDSARIVSPGTIAEFTALQYAGESHRAIGWEKPTRTNSAGRHFSPAAFGHTGFTGTSIWIDPLQDIYVLLLTNRVNPTRENQRVNAIRRTLADTVLVLDAQHRSSDPLLALPVSRRPTPAPRP